MPPSLLLLAMIASLAPGGESAVTAPTTPGTPLAAAGELVFPAAGGIEATAHYTLSSVPGGATAVLKSQLGGHGIPRPFGSGPIVAAFKLTVSKPVTMTRLPTWQIAAPTPALAKELALEVCPGATCTIWENSHATAEMISVTGVGIEAAARTLSLSPGVVYVFELVLPPSPPIRPGSARS